MNKFFKSMSLLAVLTLLVGLVVACGGNANQTGENLTGSIEIDGSSTVYPIQEAIAEMFNAENPEVQVSISASGTGGGFKRFVAGETDISNASRHIKDEEAAAAAENGIEFLEMQVANDGITVVVSKNNDFLNDITVQELNKIWTGDVTKWNQVRPEYPAEEIKLYGPGTDSGTFDYWVEAVIEADEGDEITTNFVASEDDNVLVKGISDDKFALGYFGYGYFVENEDKVKAVAVKADENAEAILPTPETIETGTYTPLSRPLFVYINKKSYIEKPQVKAYVDFLNTNGAQGAEETGFIRLAQEVYDRNKAELAKLK